MTPRADLDGRFNLIREAVALLNAPASGWIATLRSALGMSQDVLGRRMGVSRQAVSQLEQREVSGAVTLEALQQAADVIECDVVYALVPRRPIAEMLESRALALASATADAMRLQGDEREREMRFLAQHFMRRPERLWSNPDLG